MDTGTTRPTQRIAVQDAPSIPGLSFRHFDPDSDYPALLEVNTSSKIADGQDYDLLTLETLTHAYNTTRNHDLRKDVLVAEVDGKMIGYSRVFWDRELEGPRVYWHVGFVLPEWRGKGLGRAMIRWCEARAREVDATQPDREQVTALASTQTRDIMDGLENLLKDEGYEPVRYEFHMETPDLDHIPDVPMPEGLEIRPPRTEQYRAIWDATYEAFRDHWGAGEVDESDFQSFLKDPMLQPDMWVVAWDGDQVAGSILNFINHEYNQRTKREIGYTEDISVRRPWRKRGLARAMLARSMQIHKEHGMNQTALGVDTQNPSGALRLYESMGYQIVSKSTIYRKKL